GLRVAAVRTERAVEFVHRANHEGHAAAAVAFEDAGPQPTLRAGRHCRHGNRRDREQENRQSANHEIPPLSSRAGDFLVPGLYNRPETSVKPKQPLAPSLSPGKPTARPAAAATGLAKNQGLALDSASVVVTRPPRLDRDQLEAGHPPDRGDAALTTDAQ